jgi:hypothetical protein
MSIAEEKAVSVRTVLRKRLFSLALTKRRTKWTLRLLTRLRI